MSTEQPDQADQPNRQRENPSADENDKNAETAEPTAPGEKLTQEVGWSIDRGHVRNTNEDSLAAITLNQASEATTQSVGVYAVADGMGGHESGEVASKLAVRTAIRQLMADVTESDETLPANYQQWLKSAVALANQIVYNKASEAKRMMGTTLVMAVVVGHDVHIVNVGDSRAYLMSPGGIRQITHDHSFVQVLVDSGAITAQEAATHPRRNILTQSVGVGDQLTVDLFNETLGADDLLLLCSDGLWGTLNDDQIWQIVRSASTPDAACQALVDAANAAGGLDNIAAVIVRLGTPAAKTNGDSDDSTAELKLPH